MFRLRVWGFLFAALLSPVAGQAQVRVILSAEKSTFLLFEALPLSVKLTNASDERIVLNNDGGRPWLSFIIQGADRRVVRTESKLETEPLVLEPGSSRILTFDLTPHYAIRDSGQYSVQASVAIPGGRSFLTDALVLNVGKGEVIWTKSYQEAGSQRVVSLIRFIDKKDSSLYLRVEEPRENLVYTTFKLGRVISYTTPEVRIDAFRNIHVLHPVGPRLFRYTQTDANGQIVRQEDREVQGSLPPALQARDDGRVEFVGGRKMDVANERPKLSELQQGL
ncbi:MAG: hypothetical protein SFU85_03510 [Candidatus Methylacidiphilales bacterium]|nr:hypothetical protein [Candidatus Methylacidiphilales bacterium]